jgi:hypothetical protein
LARDFFHEMRRIEQGRTVLERVRGLIRFIRHFPQAIPLGEAGSPERDPRRESEFVRNLFGLIATLRTARHLIYAGVARTPCEANTRAQLDADVIQFHRLLGNQALHVSLMTPARLMYAGGPRDRTWTFCYVIDQMEEPQARLVHDRLQDVAAHSRRDRLGIIDLALDAINELESIDATVRRNGCY